MSGAQPFEMTPSPGKLIVLVDKEDEKIGTSKILIRPDTAIEPANEATVIAASDKSYFNGAGWIEPFAKTGDRVAIGKYSGVDITYKGVEYKVLKQEEVLAVIATAPAEVAVANA